VLYPSVDGHDTPPNSLLPSCEMAPPSYKEFVRLESKHGNNACVTNDS
jgi:hypothetical protein